MSCVLRPTDAAFAAFLRRHAPLGPVAECPGIRLHQAADLEAVWAALRRCCPGAAGPPPYWAIAWPGARALASHLLDRAGELRGARVLELGCGGALAAIAAARAGAGQVQVLDIDPLAGRAAAANAAANGVRLDVRVGDAFAQPAEPAWDVVLAADLWYERFLGPRATAWLRACAAGGARVLVGDNGRAFSPRAGLELLQCIDVADAHGTERGERVQVRVSVLKPGIRV